MSDVYNPLNVLGWFPTLFPVYLNYPGSGCSLALDSRHNLSRWLWVLMRTTPWHDHLLVITQAQPVITRDSLCSHTISLCPPSRVTTCPLIGQETHRSPLIGPMSCVSRMRPELLQMTQITGPDASLVTRRAWPGPERERSEVRWCDLWERGEWPAGSSGAILVWARCKQAPASQRGGKYLISGTNIQMKNVQREDLQTLNKIPSFIHGCRYLF